MVIQIVTTVFVLFALSRVIIRVFKDKASFINFFFWGGFWAMVLVVVWWPELVGKLSDIFGVGRGIDVLVYLSILGLYYSIYRIYAIIQNQERAITKLTREIAKMNASKKPKRRRRKKKTS